jgi:hypothetical protein
MPEAHAPDLQPTPHHAAHARRSDRDPTAPRNVRLSGADLVMARPHQPKGLPGVLIHRRLDLSGPLLTACERAQTWPDAELTIIEDSGHTGSPAMGTAVRNAITTFDPTDSHL